MYKYLFIFILSILALPAHALVLEGSGDACKNADGSFNQDCMYMTTAPKMSPRQALQVWVWKLSTFNGKTIDSDATISFEKTRFHAKICNTMNGRYGVFQERIIFRNTMSTMMYCEGDLMTIESALSTNRVNFMVWSESLTMTNRKGDIFVWKR